MTKFYTPRLMNLSMLFIAIVCLCGCATVTEQPQYIAYIVNPINGLTKTQVINGIGVTCSYRPTDLLVSQELNNQDNILSKASLDSLKNTYSHNIYCTLSFSRNGLEIENEMANEGEDMSQLINYLNGGIAQDIYLCGKGQVDSTVALGATYARYYGSTGCSTVLIAFTMPKSGTDNGFSIYYKGSYFGLKPFEFVFKDKDIRNLPSLRKINRY